MKPLQIEVASDVVCPWCYIGKRRLEKALALVQDLKFEVRWLPFQLNPDMPKEGMPRAEYRKAKFGSLERSRALDARVIAEGRSEGIEFAFERIERTPNTAAAHRLIFLAEDQDAVVDALFRAYFEEAKDIGDAAVLADIAARCGVEGWPGKARDVSGLEEEVRGLGISAVPTFVIERKLGVSGAYPAESLAAAMREATATETLKTRERRPREGGDPVTFFVVNPSSCKRVARRVKQPVVYILASKPYGTLYIGVTSNLGDRIEAHRNGCVDGFTKQYGVHSLVYFELHAGMYEAIEREKRLKKWNRAWKIRLIEEMNPRWEDLSEQAF